MPKHLKLKINDLKVQSFVTSLEEEKEALIKGGASASTCQQCTNYSACPTCSPTDCGDVCATASTCAATCATCVTCATYCGCPTMNPKVQTCAAIC